MGYELHIERSEPSNIPAREWDQLVANDPELEWVPEKGPYFARYLGDSGYGKGNVWFDWFQGRISTKYPDNAVLAKMLLIAQALDAQVRGDDGELYLEPDLELAVRERRPPHGLVATIRNFFLGLLPPPRNETALPFGVGDRVRDHSGVGTVQAIKRRAEAGLGRITVSYDDGRVLHYSLCAHGLEKVSPNTALQSDAQQTARR